MPRSSRPSTISRQLGDRVRLLRTARGLTQEELGERASLNTQTVSRVERGAQGAALETVEAIARALGVPMAELVTFDEGDSRSTVQRALDGLPTDPASARVRLERVVRALLGE